MESLNKQAKKENPFTHRKSVVEETQPFLIFKRDHEESRVSNRQKTDEMRATSLFIEVKINECEETEESKKAERTKLCARRNLKKRIHLSPRTTFFNRFCQHHRV